MRARDSTMELEKSAWSAYDSGDAQHALPLFIELADAGKPYYLVVAARMFMDGEGTSIDVIRAAELLDQAGALGVPEALLQRAALAARQGNSEEYYRWISLAERIGLLPAKYLLALCYLNGRGTKLDVERGMTLMRDAASSGHLVAKAFLARQLLKRGNPILFMSGLISLTVTLFRIAVLTITNRHDQRLR